MAPMLVPVAVIVMFQMKSKGGSSEGGGGISGLLGGFLGRRKKRYGGQGFYCFGISFVAWLCLLFYMNMPLLLHDYILYRT
jgi:hypothetical protein